jgi:hypothetical protein
MTVPMPAKFVPSLRDSIVLLETLPSTDVLG